MSGEASPVAPAAETAAANAQPGHHHHHHYYYFYPTEAAAPKPQAAVYPHPHPHAHPHHHHPHAHPQCVTPPSPPQWNIGAPAQPPADAPAGHMHGALNHLYLGDGFVKGLLVGAGATFLLTNEAVQKNIIRSVVRLWSVAQGGVEEVKERFRDAEAEIKSTADKS